MTPPNTIHMFWIIPQYIFLSVAEVMFAISGLEFSFTQVGSFFLWFFNLTLKKSKKEKRHVEFDYCSFADGKSPEFVYNPLDTYTC